MYIANAIILTLSKIWRLGRLTYESIVGVTGVNKESIKGLNNNVICGEMGEKRQSVD